MAFMVPEYTNEKFYRVESVNGDTAFVPEAAVGNVGIDDHDAFAMFVDFHDAIDYVEEIRGKWWARLSAPGYMDCTEWSGPFDTLRQAMADVEETWDVDPETGDGLWDE